MSALGKVLMKRGATARERALGRSLQRGRSRPSAELSLAMEMAERVAKDFGGAGSPTVASQVYTPTPDGPKKPVRKSRLQIPFSREE